MLLGGYFTGRCGSVEDISSSKEGSTNLFSWLEFRYWRTWWMSGGIIGRMIVNTYTLLTRLYIPCKICSYVRHVRKQQLQSVLDRSLELAAQNGVCRGENTSRDLSLAVCCLYARYRCSRDCHLDKYGIVFWWRNGGYQVASRLFTEIFSNKPEKI